MNLTTKHEGIATNGQKIKEGGIRSNPLSDSTQFIRCSKLTDSNTARFLLIFMLVAVLNFI